MSLALWQARQQAMRLELPRLTAIVDPLQPARGLHDIHIDGIPTSPARVLQVELPPAEQPGIDAFVRAGDLAITYAERPAPAMRTQVYWRAGSHAQQDAIAAIELLVSVQTSLLDSCPRLVARSELFVDEVLCLDDTGRGQSAIPANEPCGYLFRPAGQEFSYAEMIHPADAHGTRLESQAVDGGQRVELSHQLFAERLEKGVILRARVLGLWVDRAGDQDAAAKHFQAFLAAKLPLTT